VRPRSRSRWAAASAALVAATLLLTACAGDDDGPVGDATPEATTTVTAPSAEGVQESTEPADVSTVTEESETSEAPGVVWFASETGPLVGEVRQGAGASVRAALGELAEGPDRDDLIPAFPVGASVVGTDLEGQVVVVEVDEAFVEGYPSGSAAEVATVAPIVYTATELPGVDAVQLERAGQPLAPPTAQLDLSGPLARADFGLELVPPEVAP
jgi:spore germination protein GerM